MHGAAPDVFAMARRLRRAARLAPRPADEARLGRRSRRDRRRLGRRRRQGHVGDRAVRARACAGARRSLPSAPCRSARVGAPRLDRELRRAQSRGPRDPLGVGPGDGHPAPRMGLCRRRRAEPVSRCGPRRAGWSATPSSPARSGSSSMSITRVSPSTTTICFSEALGLYAAGVLMPAAPRADRWRTLGREILEEEAERQFYSDGAYLQQSHNYHRSALQSLLWACAFARASGDRPVSRHGLKAVDRSIDFLVAQQNPSDGRLPNYGGNDGTRPVPARLVRLRRLPPDAAGLVGDGPRRASGPTRAVGRDGGLVRGSSSHGGAAAAARPGGPCRSRKPVSMCFAGMTARASRR